MTRRYGKNILPTSSQQIQIIFDRLDDAVTLKDRIEMQGFLEKFGAKVNKITPVNRIEVFIEEAKYTTGRVAMNNITLIVVLMDGKNLIGKTKHKQIMPAIRAASKEIFKQRTREKDQFMHHQTAISG